MRLLLCCLAALALSGCVSDQTRQDIANSAEASYNAAASLPSSPQRDAIEANQAAIAKAVGHPFATPSPAPVAPAGAPIP